MHPRVVLDTNTLVQAAPDHGIYRPLILALTAQDFELVISNEILLEYEEVLTRIGDGTAWPGIKRLVELSSRAGTVHRVAPTYHWKLIGADPDDDKFVDAAVADAAEYTITTDRHFDTLKVASLLQVRPMSPADFIALLGGA